MKTEKKGSDYRRSDQPLLAVIAVLLLVATVLPAAADRNAEWRTYQSQFRQLVAARFGNALAEQVPSGVQQVWVPQLRRADRCTTCHMGMSRKGFENVAQPFRSHPKKPLEHHPIEQFGCTVCHGGQEYAVDVNGAHGKGHFWDEPLFGSRLASAYPLSGVNREALIQVNCNGCHRPDKTTAGAEAINLAKRTFAEQPCGDCHLVNGKGGTIGPDLTYIGDKHAEEFDFTKLSGGKTAYAWHIAHFKNPAAVVPSTVMPELGLTDEQAQALSMLMLSWRKSNLPAEYRPELRRAMNGHAPQFTSMQQ